MERARARVGACQRVARAGGGDEAAFGRFGAEALGCDRHVRAQRYAVLVLEDVVQERQRLGPGGHRDGILGAEFLHATMADGGDAVHPFQHGRGSLEDVGHHRDALPGEPQRVIGGEIGHAGLGAEEVVVLLDHVCDAPQVGAVGGRGVLRAQAVHAGAHGLAVGTEGLRGRGWQVGEQLGRAPRLEVVGHGGPEQRGVRPLREHAGHALEGQGIQHGLGLQVFQHVADEGRVAIDVGADLQERRAAVSARERHHVGLGRDARNDHRLPGQLLEAEGEADLFRERRRGIVVQDGFGQGRGHGFSWWVSGQAQVTPERRSASTASRRGGCRPPGIRARPR